MCSPSPAPLSFLCYDGRIHVFSLSNETNDDIAKPSIYILYVYDVDLQGGNLTAASRVYASHVLIWSWTHALVDSVSMLWSTMYTCFGCWRTVRMLWLVVYTCVGCWCTHTLVSGVFILWLAVYPYFDWWRTHASVVGVPMLWLLLYACFDLWCTHAFVVGVRMLWLVAYTYFD